ncbi:MAG: hypothetical protein EPN33_11765 [Acidobacteria bacterium]|nr:MAG: hypothetical protein EPN33_11765 [Acidobacteriota bacterium]
MALKIVEFFGYDPADRSPAALSGRSRLWCPFLDGRCEKTLSDGAPSGACTVRQTRPDPVICCPFRLYGSSYRVLRDIVEGAFGPGLDLLPAGAAATVPRRVVAVFGKHWGKELRLPQRRGGGNYFVDWILALLSPGGVLEEFVAVEVQAIDTTGNYRDQRSALLKEEEFPGMSKAGLNWENVAKRILPQLIYKGHVLRREPLCQKGLFFVCPTPVYQRIRERLGGNLLEYAPQPGALTFRWYDLGCTEPPGTLRVIIPAGQITTTVDQVALAFTSPSNLPPSRVYEQAIMTEIGKNG